MNEYQLEKYEEFKVRFRNMEDKELVEAFNREVGNNGWVSSRLPYLVAMREEFAKRGFDTGVFGSERVLRLRRFEG